MIAALALMAASDARAARAVCVENAPIGELRQALSTGDATAAGLVEGIWRASQATTAPARASMPCAS